MKTITVNGFEYEIGGLYMDETGCTGYLSHYSEGNFTLLCCPDDEDESFISPSITKIARVGEITKAEITPINGEYYKFEYYADVCCLIGYYSEDKGVFVVAGIYYHVEYCTNFKLMKEA